jgi:hypothetical protein
LREEPSNRRELERPGTRRGIAGVGDSKYAGNLDSALTTWIVRVCRWNYEIAVDTARISCRCRVGGEAEVGLARRIYARQRPTIRIFSWSDLAGQRYCTLDQEFASRLEERTLRGFFISPATVQAR